MLIFKEKTFDAAHILHWHEGKCAKLHGHTYKLQVGIGIGKLNENGVIMDFGDLDNLLDSLLVNYDHLFLNDILDNPTVENLAIFICNELQEELPSDVEIIIIRLWETPTSWVEYKVKKNENNLWTEI